MKRIVNIVLTGGPCGGKTKSIKALRVFLMNLGYKVIVIPEIATETIMDGFIPSDECITQFDFQKIIFERQLFKENLYREMCSKLSDSKIVIISDRGLMDNKIYLSEEEFDKIKNEHQISDDDIFERYDAVFHLVSTATAEDRFYNKSSNVCRLEDSEEARVLEKRGIEIWKKHRNFYIIDFENEFETKLNKLKIAIMDVLE